MSPKEIQNLPNLDATIAWLLESPTPSIRYLTLTRILGKPEGDAETQTARRLIAESSPAKDILAQQHPEGYWMYRRHIYSPKYRSSHWSMVLLCELGLDAQTPALQRGADFMLDKMEKDILLLKDEEQTHWGCLWANMLRYFLYCGRLADERVQLVLDYVCRDVLRGSQCPYNADLPCAWGVIRGLYGLALIPEAQRDEQSRVAIQAGLKFMLADHSLLNANYPNPGKIHPLWSKLSYPLFYSADIPFVLRTARELNALHYAQAKPGMEWLLSRRHKNGRWNGGSPYQRRTWSFLAEGDSISRWITLQALSVIS